ncbi:TetR/AcrR family transcriptional regulator [Actinokineospora xionganensis]|uniref:TetR/AcrR family transcriptional regulator n=1 Tax=Actinokineospora xionganensis TaxID=2684470 RepID=A0ABR7L013_9PSEU|nr:TetR/AcrR family transcriptional regulator [Actinokineospora xionganensis]MBC6446020.1 TetR/AcrR family transcriptional regulator [Actinokineospora xionganensis]
MGALRTPREKWIDEGLRVLADGGVDAVRVDALAKSLGVTRGGFYGYFADRGALLEAMLDAWERETTDDVLDQIGREGGDLTEKAWLAGQLTFSDRLLPIDLAVRDWARRDQAVAGRLRRVDNKRMELLREAIGTVCADPEEVEARCLLAFCGAIGSHFLAADHPGSTRAQVMARACEIILNRPPGNPTT